MIEQKDLCDYGLSGSGARGAYVRNKQNIQELLILAQDAAMQTSPNIAVPAVLTSYIDTAVTNVLFDPRNATKLAREVKAGSWTTSTYIFRVAEGLGYIAPYGDFSPNGRSDVNYNFPRREQAKFQTVIEYGDFEEELLAEAKINYIADKQRAAALTVSIASNYFYLYGVKGMEVYGYLNDPNLNAAIAASPTGTGGGIKWSTKDTLAIYNDILTLFAELVNQNKNITANYKIKLALSPSCNVELGKATQYNISVMDMLNKYFVGGIEIIVLPELEESNGDSQMIMSVEEIDGEQVAEAAFGEKFRVFPLVREMSGQKQKIAFSTYGSIIKQPSGIAVMTGI